jgi:hypothetical protein
MTENGDKSLEERRMALEELTAQRDYELRVRELDVKRSESSWMSRLFTPLTTTIFAGILTLAASVAGTLMQGRSTLALEREKFESTRKLEQEKFNAAERLEVKRGQQELILKMVSVGDEKQSKANLRFLAESKLIDEELAKRVLEAKEVAVIPPSSLQQSSALPIPDEAISKAQEYWQALEKGDFEIAWNHLHPFARDIWAKDPAQLKHKYEEAYGSLGKLVSRKLVASTATPFLPGFGRGPLYVILNYVSTFADVKECGAERLVLAREAGQMWVMTSTIVRVQCET